MLLARFLFQEASLFWFKNSVLFRSTPSLLSQGGLHILTKPSLLRREGCNRPAVLFFPTCPSPAGGSLTHSQALALSKRARDVTALRCSEPLRSKVGGASKPSPCFAGWDRLGTACFWLHCAWGQLASFPRHVLRAGTAWGTLKVKICVICAICVTLKGKKVKEKICVNL